MHDVLMTAAGGMQALQAVHRPAAGNLGSQLQAGHPTIPLGAQSDSCLCTVTGRACFLQHTMSRPDTWRAVCRHQFSNLKPWEQGAHLKGSVQTPVLLDLLAAAVQGIHDQCAGHLLLVEEVLHQSLHRAQSHVGPKGLLDVNQRAASMAILRPPTLAMLLGR